MGMGIKCGSYSLDDPSIENELKSKRFLAALFSRWPHQSGSAIRQVRSMQKLLRGKVIPV
jgi:hypothetical protein